MLVIRKPAQVQLFWIVVWALGAKFELDPPAVLLSAVLQFTFIQSSFAC
jgi:hypothetical protein